MPTESISRLYSTGLPFPQQLKPVGSPQERTWYRLEARQRLALVDHELQHCHVDSEGHASLVKHDVEEFNCILERHGWWWPGAETTAQAVNQMPLLTIERVRKPGRVDAIDPGAINGLLN